MKRVCLLALLLPWPFALQGLAARAGQHAEALGFRLGALQRDPLPPLAPPLESEPSVARFEQLAGDAPIFDESPASPKVTTKRQVGQRGKAAPEEKNFPPRFGIHVRQQTVLRLANARAIPGGTYVPADAVRPAGMQLHGVSGFGVGLRDGDVLTQVAGAPATSRSQVVSAVLQARAARAPAISAIFWRDGEPWRLLVEMPYLRGG